MKTLKVMSIITMVITGITVMVLAVSNNVYDYEGAIGWGWILSLWCVAYSIVGVVQASKNR